MPVIDLPLTPAQARKLSQGKRIRLTKGQVSREGDAVSVNMSSRLASKITRRLKAGKGFQLAHEWDSHATSGDGIGNPFKKLARATAGVVKTIRKKAPGVLKQVGHETGRIAQQAKKYVPRGIVKGAIADLSLAATSAIGQPELAPLMRKALNPAVDAVYDTNLAKGSVGKNFGRNYAKNFVNDGVNSLFTMG